MKGRKPGTITPGNVVEIPRPPAWISKDAKAEWRRIMPDLVERKILTDADLGMVEAYCVAIGRVREVERMIRAGGPIIDPKIFRMQNQAMQTARQIAAEIGATPVARSRPAVRDDNDGDDLSFLG